VIDQDIKDTTDLGPDPFAEPQKPPPVKPERDKRGWFAKGNTVSKGHASPHAAKVVALRSVFFEEITPERWRKLVLSMWADACGVYDRVEGKWSQRPNVKAAEFIADRMIGKPIESTAEERLRRIEDSLGLDDSLDPARIADVLNTARRHGDNGEPGGDDD
jgi:hypothetical protein